MTTRTIPAPGASDQCIDPPDGIEPELWMALADSVRAGWETLSDDYRREVLAAARAGLNDPGPTYAERVAEINAKADPAANAAFDRLTDPTCPPGVDPLTGEIVEDVAVPLTEEPSKEKPRHDRCGVPLLGRSGGRLVVRWGRCKVKSCTVCAESWQQTKLAGLNVVADALVGGNLDASPTLRVGVVRDDEWTTTRTRLGRHGAGYFSVPAPDQTRFVITDDSDFGSPHPLQTVLAKVAEALETVSANPNENRQTRFSQSWLDIIDAATVEPETSDDIEWLGVATKVATPQVLAEKAKRCGGIAAPVASLNDEHPETATVWAVKVPTDHEWRLLGLIGFETFQENADKRARRRAQRNLEDLARRRWRRPLPDCSGIERRAVA